MSLQQQYRELFDKEIIQKSKGIIFSFCPIKNCYQFNPYAHAVSGSGVEELAELMRHNLLFYAFGEEEVVRFYKEDMFESLENAAKYAYKQRLPKRANITDGLPSEALLDLLVQMYNPNAYKLAIRTIFRQDDNNEIKGYDLTYFTKDQTGISLWLGQAKLGEKDYCKTSISKDLLTKYTNEYLAKQIYFICDKRVEITDDAKDILAAINRINVIMIDQDEPHRIAALLEHFQKSNIKIRIPCLLAYGESSVYSDAKEVFNRIQTEVESIRQYYAKHSYSFGYITPEIIFYVFPIESVERLRDKDRGFYAGLC